MESARYKNLCDIMRAAFKKAVLKSKKCVILKLVNWIAFIVCMGKMLQHVTLKQAMFQ